MSQPKHPEVEAEEKQRAEEQQELATRTALSLLSGVIKALEDANVRPHGKRMIQLAITDLQSAQNWLWRAREEELGCTR